jgi:hypothetical protein
LTIAVILPDFLLGSEQRSEPSGFNYFKVKKRLAICGTGYKSDKSGLIAFKPHNMIKVNDELELLTPDNCCKIKVQEFIDDQG